MRENSIYAFLRQWLATETVRRGLPGPVPEALNFMQRYQPLQQGRPSPRTVYWHNINNQRIGSALVTNTPTDVGISRREVQSMALTLQFTCTQQVDLAADALTQGDVLNIVAASLQGQNAVAWFVERGLSVERVTQIRNVYFNNDRDQNEPNPSFDLVIKHNDIFVDGVPEISGYELDILRVPNLPA